MGKGQGGRPIIYRKEFCKIIEDAIASGHTKEAAAGFLDVHRDTVRDWSLKYPEFSAAIKRGEAKRIIEDEKVLKMLARGQSAKLANGDVIKPRDINIVALLFKMKNQNRDTYGDKIETKETGSIKIDISKDESDL
jgi:hypothetical protein